MFRHYLHITLKHLWKRRLYSFITLLSLTLGLSVFSLIFLHVKHELSYNKGWQGSSQIYRLLREQPSPFASQGGTTSFTTTDLTELEKFLEGSVEVYTEIRKVSTVVEESENYQGLSLALTGESFLEMFRLTALEGSIERALEAPGFVALERGVAETLLGKQDSYLGKKIRLSSSPIVTSSPDFEAGTATEFEVAAIYELPEPLSFSARFQAVSLFSSYSEALMPTVGGNFITGGNVWLKLPEDTSASEIDRQLLTFVDEYSPYMRNAPEMENQKLSEIYHYWLQNLEEIYFDQSTQDFPKGDMSRLITFSVIGLFVLMAGCSNAISLGLAGALERRREVGIRKAVGAVQRSIVMQYLGESMSLALLAMLSVLLLIHWLRPVFARYLSIINLPAPGIQEIILLLAIGAVVGLLNGLYPALVLARVKPVSVLKAHTVSPRMRTLNVRSLLVGVQFTISTMLLIGTLGLYTQLYVTRQQPLGYETENLALASVNYQAITAGGELGQILTDKLLTVPGISGASAVSMSPGSSSSLSIELTLVTDQQQEEGVKVNYGNANHGQFALVGIPVLAGREFDSVRDALPTQQPATPEEAQSFVTPVLINRMTMRALGYATPEQAVNSRIYRRNEFGPIKYHFPSDIVGVVEDSRYRDLRSLPSAEVYSLSTGSNTVMFRYEDSIEESLQQTINDIWVEATGYPAGFTFIDDVIRQAYGAEQRESQLLLLCAGLALFLSSVGLFGLVSVAMRTQIKEIGVRKTLGATTASVVLTYLKRFSLPVLLANFIAWPVAAYFVLQWIQQFPYQLDKAWLLPICLFTSALVLIIAWVTVGGLTFRAASAKPVKSLRYE